MIAFHSAFEPTLPLPLRLALRSLRGGLSGFAILIACLALGVMVITAVGSLSDTLDASLARDGGDILGGDIGLSRMHKRADPAETAVLSALGRLSETASLRTLARTADGTDQMLVELRGADSGYPMLGRVEIEGAPSLQAAIARGVVVEPILLEQLKLKVGDQLKLGTLDVPITGVITKEPGTLGDRMSFGARAIVSVATLEATGLVQPGSLVRWKYALKRPDGADLTRSGLKATVGDIEARLTEAGFTSVTRHEPAPGLKRTLEQVRQFLTLIGLTALIIGGIGVSNAVQAYVARRRKVIATFKSLGASNARVLSVLMSEVLLICGAGIVMGLLLGAVAAWGVTALLGDAVASGGGLVVRPATLGLASLYGLLVALLFMMWPLGVAEQLSPSVLYRTSDRAQPWPRLPMMAICAGLGMALLALATLSTDQHWVALGYCTGIAVILGLFLGLGTLVGIIARRLPRPRNQPALALALLNLGAGDGLARQIVLSMGTGLSLLTAVALTDAGIRHELSSRLPSESPGFFVLDVARADMSAFTAAVDRSAPATKIESVPMLRGRIVAIKGTPVEKVSAPAEAQWVLSGDKGVTFSDTLPKGSTVVSGAWWSPAEGEGSQPLVSLEADIAAKLGLKLQDTITVNILGRNIEARIANFRKVAWENLGLNFIMVFSPASFAKAPYTLLATLTLKPGSPLDAEAKLARDLGREFPTITPIRVKDAIAAFAKVLEKVMLAVQLAGGVTLAMGALVLAGAFATAERRRIAQTVILKALGASRPRIMLVHGWEYAVTAVVTTLGAVMLGSLAAYLALTRLLETPFWFSPTAVGTALALALSIVGLMGAASTWSVLEAKTAAHLRNDA